MFILKTKRGKFDVAMRTVIFVEMGNNHTSERVHKAFMLKGIMKKDDLIGLLFGIVFFKSSVVIK